MEKVKVVLLVILLCSLQGLSAQHTVSGKVESEDGKSLPDVSVFFMVQDTLVAGTVSDAKGNFRIKDLPGNEYSIRYVLLGYKVKQQQVTIAGDSRLETVQLEEDPVALGEVVVDANRSDVVKMEAGRMTFFLSDKKKNVQTIYEVLTEIPVLISNVSNRTVKLADGSSPIILINGVKRDLDLALLDPRMVEAVEVIDNPSARYRGEYGDIKVLNLKVKRSDNLLTFDWFTKQALHGKFGIYQPTFGLEKEKFSFSLSLQDWYSGNKKTEFDNWTNTGNMERNMSGSRQAKQNSLYIGGNGDWVISDKDYLSYGAIFITNPGSSTSTEDGFVALAGDRSPLSVLSESKSTYVTGNYNVFYRRTFSSLQHYEVTAVFGHHKAGPEGWREEKSDFYSYRNRIDMDNVKQYAQAEMNYDFVALDKWAMNIGSNTYFQNISLRESDISFPYKETREYLYGDIRNKNQSKFSYMFSLGLDMVFRNAGHVKKNYVTVLPSLSLSYKLSNKSSIRLNANRTRVSPSLDCLNPYVTTTDSLAIQVGNPYLKPSVSNFINLSYSLNGKWIFFMPEISYNYRQDNVIPVGELEGDVYKSTYTNGDHSHFIRLGVTMGIRLGNFGNLNITPSVYKTKWAEKMSYDGKTWGINANAYLYYKKVYFNGYMHYSRYDYTRTTRSANSPMVEMMLGWQLPKNWQVHFSIRDNSKSMKMWQKDGHYRSYMKSYAKHESWTPMLGFSYTFRNNKSFKQRQKTYKRGDDQDSFNVNVK